MTILVWGLALFLFAFLAHLALWRVHLPRHHIAVLLRLYAVILAAGLLALPLLPARAALLGAPPPRTLAELLHVGVLFVALALAWIVTYTALPVDSPSLTMLLEIAAAGPAGLPAEDLERLLTDEVLVRPRLADLVRERMVEVRGDRYALTAPGRRYATLFARYRLLMRLPVRGG
jgi:hypothetical protein